MSLRIVWIAIAVLLVSVGADAQELSTLREKRVLITSDTTVIDTLLIVPNSLHVLNIDTSNFNVLESQSEIVWTGGSYPSDSILISYRIISFDFKKEYRNKETNLIGVDYQTNPFAYIPNSEKRNSSPHDDIKTIGNISRGVGFGNKQDVTVNSNLNLRLNGRIQNKIDIIAAISDENNPIQPEGNTQQIQDFDRVYIQLKQDSASLIAGDFPMSTPDSSYFMKYNKKSRGLQIQRHFTNNKGYWQFAGEGAVSRGRFSRNTVAGIEGNQGPYRLSGANGETFIIIISGTEQVYLDGQLLTRGEQNDYIINYNTGELTFTPKRLITQYSRIVIEFQYSDRNYGRSVVRFGGSYTQGKWNIRGNFFNEQDNKNQPFQQNLDDSTNGVSTRQFLSNAGDAELVFAPKFTEITEVDPNQITYVQRDSNGITIFVQTQPGDLGSQYRVSFSYVGPGNGDYTQKLSTANGKVFEWVDPFVGNPGGDYAPVEIIVPPKKLEMINLGFDYELSKTTLVSLEFARSNNDINTFSPFDKENDVGYGIRLDIKNTSVLSKDTIKPWKLKSKLSFERTEQDFRYIERYRNVEFDRKWNRTLDNPIDNEKVYTEERIANALLILTKGNNAQFIIDESFYQQGSDDPGLSHSITGQVNDKGYFAKGAFEQITSTIPIGGISSNNQFTRYAGSVGKRSSFFQSSFEYQNERSAFANSNDSLFGSSYAFDQMTLKLASSDSNRLKYSLEANRRLDYRGDEGQFEATTDGRDASLNLGWRQSRNAQFNLTSSYRELYFRDTSNELGAPENTLQGRFETRLVLLKKLITTNAYYQLGTGQQQRREYSYLEVGDGNGNYVWNDYDSNGIQSLNEFELASTFDIGRANFIRQFLPIQGFIKSYSSEFNQNIRIRPASVLRKSKKKSLKFIRRFSNVSSVKIQKKVTNNQDDFINPFVQNVADSSLLSTNSVIRSVLSFNQSSPVFGIDYQWFKNQNKILLVNGVDARNGRENKLKMRYNINRNYELVVEASQGNKTYTSQFLTDRAFSYDFNTIKPKLGYQYKSNFRIELYYAYFEAKNGAQYGKETTYNHDVTTELRWNFLNKGTIRTNIGLVDINYNGNDNSPVAYELLAGLKNGRNVKWRLQIEQRFSNNIQLLVNYDGRQSIDSPVIHIGRVQARYLF
ncbi:MAG: hypothetical protein ACI8SE_000733 [Bacteroidia bacterium]|jgi:hypothetical protein